MTNDFYQTNPDAVSLTEQNLTKFAYGIQNNYYPFKAFLGLLSSVNSFHVTSNLSCNIIPSVIKRCRQGFQHFLPNCF